MHISKYLYYFVFIFKNFSLKHRLLGECGDFEQVPFNGTKMGFRTLITRVQDAVGIFVFISIRFLSLFVIGDLLINSLIIIIHLESANCHGCPRIFKIQLHSSACELRLGCFYFMRSAFSILNFRFSSLCSLASLADELSLICRCPSSV